MSQPADFIINFHGIGKVERAYDPGEEPFWSTERDFEEVLDLVERQPSARAVRLTFDDGNRSDYAIAAPALLRRGLKAIFFVLAGRLGQPGYLSTVEVRELCKLGFEIESHGFDHVDWTRASDESLEREICSSKAAIEDVIGGAVRRAAIPFGRYDRRVLRAARRGGYTEVFSSDGGPRLTNSWPIPRCSVRRDIDVETLAGLVEGSGRYLSRVRSEARLRVKASIRRGAAPFGLAG